MLRKFCIFPASNSQNTTLEEKEVIAGLKRGNGEAYRLLVNAYSGKIYSLALSVLQHETEAEDLTQEVFTTICLSIGQFRNESKLSTWIYRITINKCREHLRRNNRKKRFAWLTGIEQADTVIALFHHPGIALENKERASVVMQALTRLPENQRIAFTMHKMEGYSYEEAAEAMGLSLSSVESLIFRARKQLRDILQDYYDKNER